MPTDNVYVEEDGMALGKKPFKFILPILPMEILVSDKGLRVRCESGMSL